MVIGSSNLPEEWFDLHMPIGGRGHRYQHPDCSEGKDNALLITRSDKGWLYHCFRCGLSGFKPARELGPERMGAWLKTLKERPTEVVRKITLPADFTEDIPVEGLVWLYSGGATDADIRRFKIGYSPHSHRVILPVYENNSVLFWEGRFLGIASKKQPKYKKVWQADRKDITFSVDDYGQGSVCIVEDVLSAIRVSKIVDTHSVLSIHIPEKLVFRLSDRYDEILLWLDPDKHTKMVKLLKRYQMLGIRCRMVSSDRDPKHYNEEQIRRLIKCNTQN